MKILGIALALMLSAGLRADVLYDSLTPQSSGEIQIGNGTTQSVLYDSFSTGNVAETLSSLVVGLAPFLSPQDPITATLYMDNGSSAGNPIQLSGGTVIGTLDDTLVTGPGDYAISLTSNPLLAANTRYWIGLSGVGTVDWLISANPNGTGVFNEFSDDGGSNVTANSSTNPFQMQVEATTPEPGSLVTLFGLLGLGFVQLRRRSSLRRPS